MNAPADILANDAVLTMTELATVLKLHHTRGAKRGQPDRRQALALVDDGKIRVVDPSQPNARWTVSTAEVRRYLNPPVVRVNDPRVLAMYPSGGAA